MIIDTFNVCYVRTVQGNEIIGEVVSDENPDLIVLRRPMFVTLTDRKGIGYFDLAPYTYTCEILSFSKRYICEYGTPTDQLASLYIRIASDEDQNSESFSDEEMDDFLNEDDGYEEMMNTLNRSKRVTH